MLRWHQTADVGVVPNPALPGVFMAVAIDTRDPVEHPAYTVTGLHPRYKQVVAERLGLAGLSVAYRVAGLPRGGPFPTRVVRVEGGLRVVYDQQVEYRGGGGFHICYLPPTQCDASNNLM